MTIPLNPQFIPAFSIEDVLLDKDTGAPLAGGLVYFEYDNQRGLLKPIYQITGSSPNYSFIELPNPMTLSSIGTFVDALDNPVIPYFFPYDAEGDVDLYYVRVTNSDDVPQFDREAQPYIGAQNEDSILSVITNEISNPQFAEVLFDTSAGAYTYNVNTVTNEVISIAPDWDLIVSASGVGSVTVTQSTPTGSLNVITNPGTILTITSSGLSKLQLRQRILGSPNLWGSGYLSASVVAKTYSGTGVTLNMFYSQSNGSVVDQLLLAGALPASGAYGEFAGSALIPASNSVHTFPTAYIDIYFDIPLSIQIDITSIMVAFTGDVSIDNINYDQESLARQIDHLYHYAYPIVPIGAIIDFFGFDTPLHYYFADGAAKNRISDFKLFQALTTTEMVNLTTAIATFTVVDGSKYAIGMGLEGTGIPPYATIIGISTNTITMSSGATSTIASTVRFYGVGTQLYETVSLTSTVSTFTVVDGTKYAIGMAVTGTGIPASTVISNIVVNTVTISHPANATVSSLLTFYAGGVGDGSTTFNIPDLRGYVLAGSGVPAGFTLFSSTGVGAIGGSPTHTLLAAELPPHTHTANVYDSGSSANFAKGNGTTGGNTGTTMNGPGTSTPFNIIQPTTLARKCIRYQ